MPQGWGRNMFELRHRLPQRVVCPPHVLHCRMPFPIV